MNTMHIAVVGSGYVGLVVGACMAEHGRSVICVDTNEEKLAKLRMGEVPFYEPGLEALVRRNFKNGRLTFTQNIADTLKDCDIVILAVGTPPKGDGSTDLAQVLDAAQTIARNMTHPVLVITKSTVPVGTTLKVKEEIRSITSIPIRVAFNPEFLREGNAVEDFMHPSRTVVGCEDEEVAHAVRELYKPFITPKNPFMVTDILSAEMIKYAANSLLATKISFINDIANLCEKLGADVEAVKSGIGLDPRIGDKFLDAGLGFGGSCFPKDLKSLIHIGSLNGEELPILRAVVSVNHRMRESFVTKIKQTFGEDLTGRAFACWGLAFKPNTDDLREAPSIHIIGELLKAGAVVKAYDPEAMATGQAEFGDRIEYHQNAYSACNHSDALLILTEWTEFSSPDWERVRKLLKSPLIFDGRNMYETSLMQKNGFEYHSIGRKPILLG